MKAQAKKSKEIINNSPKPAERLVSQQYELVAIESIQPHECNVNKGDVQAIAQSIVSATVFSE